MNSLRYQWLPPGKLQQDYVVDEKFGHRSELLVVTTDFDFHWYCVNDYESHGERGGAETQEALLVGCKEPREQIRVELLAVLKRTDLCTKLRKMAFREFKLWREQ